jgi:hypothetical protein
MLIISFKWTIGPLLAGLKTNSRRFWSDSHAQKFKKGMLVQAYDDSPRFGGQRAGITRLTANPWRQKLSLMTDEDEIKEGGLWGSAAAYVEFMGGSDRIPYVIELTLVEKEVLKAYEEEKMRESKLLFKVPSR